MANDVVMPRLGWTMEVGTVVEWLKRDGEAVTAGEPIFTVEADKGIAEVEALDDGVLRIPADSPLGVEVPVGTRLAYITAPGAAIPDGPLAQPVVASSTAAEPSPAQTAFPVGGSINGRPRISPRARRRARELQIDWTTLTGSGGTGRIIEKDVIGASLQPPAPRPRATPAVRQLAGETGIALDSIPATGPVGRVTRADVRLAATAFREVPPRPAHWAGYPRSEWRTGGEGTRHGVVPSPGVSMTPIRRLVSQRMATAARTVAPVTLTTDADATELVTFRARLKEELSRTGEQIPSLTDLVVRLTALTLLDHPDLNASLEGETIVRHDTVHVGIAVDTDRGLVVPVVRDAHLKSIHTIAAESMELIAAARAGTLATSAMSGGTFTISNLGMFDVDAFTPIVNLPECAILGLGRVVARPVVIDEDAGTVAVRRMLTLSLTFDHRLVDGAPAARFLQHIKRTIERPFVPFTR